MNITIQRGPDGFGSQMVSIISGICYAKVNGLNYLHSPIYNLKLKSNDDLSGELNEVNQFVDNIILNLGYKHLTQEDTYQCYAYFHHEIYGDVDKYYTENFLKFLSNGYTKDKPKFYDNDRINIAIHIRRGADIFEDDIPHRVTKNSLYEEYISILIQKYPNAKIHIFSWTDPYLSINSDNIVYHISDSGSGFIEHFNALVHADILLVASSTFSISAGLFNKNIVISNNNIHKLHYTAIPKQWNLNSLNILGE